jgi:hypothetical protein
MHRSLPQSGQLFRMLLFFDAVAGGIAYGAWHWAQRNEAALLRDPVSRLWVEGAVALAAVLLATLLVRWGVYRSSSWEPSFGAALLAVVTTPVLGALLLRSIAVADVGQPAVATTGLQLRHQTAASRMGATKRLSEL